MLYKKTNKLVEHLGMSWYETKTYYSPSNPYVYIWYNSREKKFYIGSTNGKTKSYTHSSSKMEYFNNLNVPSYMHRKVLKEFTDPKECKEFEKKIIRQRLRKNRSRYYNVFA